ncbi:hypothetical protein MXD63_41190, partial [Frankia sp. Cpl3]|nr:hypothetical protein [Frankia sp. Cpl3]
MTVSDRIFIMEKGVIVQSGDPEQVYRSPANEFVARFIGNYNVFTGAEWQRLFNRPLQAETSYAVRPEAMRLLSQTDNSPLDEQDGWVFSGRVIGKTLKGNVIRVQVEANGLLVIV